MTKITAFVPLIGKPAFPMAVVTAGIWGNEPEDGKAFPVCF